MEIKEKDEQHMVIEVTRSGCSLIFGLVVLIVWTFLVFFLLIGVIINNHEAILPILALALLSVVGVLGTLHILRTLMAIRIVLDKPAQTVTIRKPSLFLVRRQRVIPFSYVGSVVIDYAPEVSGGWFSQWSTSRRDAWKVSLNIGVEKFEIAHTTEERDMFNLASEINRFIGRELADNSAKRSPFEGLLRKLKGFFRKGGS